MTTRKGFSAYPEDDGVWLSIANERASKYWGALLTVDEASRLRDVLDQAIEQLQNTEQAA